jgi:hypothetical protein
MIWWEQLARGDRHDPTNVFGWDHITLNLPGSENYVASDPWVYKTRADGSVANDFRAYVDDLRATGQSQEECWQATRRIGSSMSFIGIQDASRKRREVSQTPGAWAGSVVATNGEEVVVMISQERWDKTQLILSWIKGALDEDADRIPFKPLESHRGFLVYVTRTYPAAVPYLKGIHLTLDGWRPGRDEDGWATNRHPDEEMFVDEGIVEEVGAPSHVKAVPRLRDDVNALQSLFAGDLPVRRRFRAHATTTALYGFGDASGEGFGSSVLSSGQILYRLGRWTDEISGESSNFRELLNLVITVEEHLRDGRLENHELFLFTDNMTAESAFYRGSSKSRKLFDLVLRLRRLQMRHDLHLHVIHVAGKRMIAQGTDGLSRGNMNEGVFGNQGMMEYVPLHLSALDRSPGLLAWILSWYRGQDLEVLEPDGWFADALDRPMSHCLWTPAPAAADVAVEQLCYARLKRSWGTHIVVVPRLLTSRWRKQLTKTADVIFTIETGESYWDMNQHEPLLIAICLPLFRSSPWRLKGTPFVERVEGRVREMQKGGDRNVGPVLHEFLLQARALEGMRKLLVRSMLHG